jgi:hypothetical protein
MVPVLALTLVGCGTASTEGNPVPERGTVVAKVYDDPDFWTEEGWCLSYDSDNVCDSRTPDVKRHDPAHWYLRLYDEARDRLVTHEVPEPIYEGCRVGAQWREYRCPN